MDERPNGFSLIELLVVVVIVGAITAIAIPSLLASRRAANQAAVVATLRNIHSANTAFMGTGGSTYAPDFAALSAASLLDPTWTGSPVRDGYTFAYTPGTSNYGFCITAIATGSGHFHYAISHKGVIWQLAAAAPACDPDTGESSDGVVVGS